MKTKIILALTVFSLTKIYSQGCSDAGICYLSSNHKSEGKNVAEIGYVFGKGIEDVVYHNGFLGYKREFSEKFTLSSRITYNQAHGNFGTLGMLGDGFLIGNYTVKKQEESSIDVSLGVKIPFTNANQKINNISLPMDYQSSLGTFDALLGLDYKIKKWQFNAAIQLPVVQSNKNSYFDEFSASDVFPTTNLFERKPDFLLRGTYKVNFKNEKWKFKPNILAIYHLGNDTYESVLKTRQQIKGSQGLTINANLVLDYSFNGKNMLELSLASPLLVREIRPDGLTRALTAALIYQRKF
jgi:hypothetical protein